MAASLVDLVKITCTSSGTGSFLLGTAVTGFRGAEALDDGSTYSYSVQQGADWEYGYGVYAETGSALTRAPIGSSNSGAPVPFTAGAQIGFVLLAEDVGGGGGGGAVINDNIISSSFVWSSFKNNAQIVSSAATLSSSVSALATSTANALATKEPTIAPGNAGQYWRGDKTWQTLDKSAAGLGNVDNTSDASKPVSMATAVALNLRVPQIGLFATAASAIISLSATRVATTGFGAAAHGPAYYDRNDALVDAAYVIAHPRTSFRAIDENGTAHGYLLSLAQVITGQMFGQIADDDGSTGTDDTAALQAWLSFLSANKVEAAVGYGSSVITSELVFDPNYGGSVDDTAYTTLINFSIRLRATATMDHMVHLKRANAMTLSGNLHLIGGGFSNYAARLACTGLYIEDLNNSDIDLTIFTECMLYAGVETANSPSNCNMSRIRHIFGKRVGSAPIDGNYPGVSSTFSGRVDTGGSGSYTQRSTITCPTLPHPYTDPVDDVSARRTVFVRITGIGSDYLYTLKEIDRANNKISLRPWLPAGVTSGNLEYYYGPIFDNKGSDANLISVGTVSGTYCGGVLAINSLYGGDYGVVHGGGGCGIALRIGQDPSNTVVGFQVERFYCEGSVFKDVLLASGALVNGLLSSPSPIDISRFQSALGVRDAGGVLSDSSGLTGLTLAAENGGTHQVNKRPNVTTFDLDFTWPTTRGMHYPGTAPVLRLLKIDPIWYDLFAYDGGAVLVSGPTAGGAPTSATFRPLSGQTVNGGTVGADYVFTGLSGPTWFDCFLARGSTNWIVRIAYYNAEGIAGVAARGDVSVTLTRGDKITQRFSAGLTANRGVTLPAPGVEGTVFNIVREGGGAFSLDVGGLKTLGSAGTWCDVKDDGTAWRLVRAGTL